MSDSDLGRRILVAAAGIPIVLGAIYVGGWALGVLVAGVAVLAAREFFGLAGRSGGEPYTALGAAASAGIVLYATWQPRFSYVAPTIGWGVVALTLVALAISLRRRWPDGEPLVAVATTLTGFVYVGCSLAFVPLLRELPDAAPGALTGNRLDATAFLLLPLLATWASDSAAYFVGSTLGRHRFVPAVSPKKSVEGAVAGLAAAGAAGVLVSWWALAAFPLLTVPLATGLWIGVLVGVAAQLGDLVESVLKREAGVKDSGTLLPGHGGALDRIDSLLFAFPAAYGLLHLAWFL